IRFWEKEFSILKPRKNKKGDRLFKKEDVKNLQLIYYLLRNKKYSIEGAKEYLQANAKKASLHQELSDTLHHLKNLLLELKA
ncbi:MerR family transcriptional regulator, partial [Acinetobacter baumannii]